MLVEYKNVSVRYGCTDILRDISFTIEPGVSVGIVGRSGSGKSTLARLLFRAMDPDSGAVHINGIPLSHYQKNTVLRHIGAILQRSDMISGNARENIMFATHKEDLDNVPDSSIWNILDALTPSLRERLNGHGLDTLVGKHGLQLSDGQQQLICIARALVKNPEFLIVDEATASLDAETEMMVQQGIDTALSRGRSAMVIAHRLSTQRNCDRIIVLKKVSECEPEEPQIEMICNSPREAYELSPTYRRLAQLQGFRP
ncbi:ATP-binding cassette domain-containing protein [Candidatus Nomurabacteria bacterium]|nr:ATP-binding cassette domain-containing protein [Candidatus Nomurabacteria bacterium]